MTNILISSILPGSLGREAQKSVDVKALKFYFHLKEVHEQVLMVIIAMGSCYSVRACTQKL